MKEQFKTPFYANVERQKILLSVYEQLMPQVLELVDEECGAYVYDILEILELGFDLDEAQLVIDVKKIFRNFRLMGLLNFMNIFGTSKEADILAYCQEEGITLPSMLI